MNYTLHSATKNSLLGRDKWIDFAKLLLLSWEQFLDDVLKSYCVFQLSDQNTLHKEKSHCHASLSLFLSFQCSKERQEGASCMWVFVRLLSIFVCLLVWRVNYFMECSMLSILSVQELALNLNQKTKIQFLC